MAWVEFTADHDHHIGGHAQTIAYLAGTQACVTHDCAADAIALGRAHEIPTPSRPEPPDGQDIGEDSAPAPDVQPADDDVGQRGRDEGGLGDAD